MIKERLFILDFYRGIAALMVFLYHYQETFPTEILKNPLFLNGYIFTDYFFVLSGFIIHKVYRSSHDINTFLVKRFNRIYPLLIVITFVYFLYRVLGNILVAKSDLMVLWDICKQFFYSIFLLNSTPFYGNLSGTIGPSWSISAEFISYLVYAFFFLKRVKQGLVYLLIFSSIMILFHLEGFYYSNDWGFVRTIIGFFTGVFISEYSTKKITIILSLIGIFSFLFADDELSKGLTFNIIFGIVILISMRIKTGVLFNKLSTYFGLYSFGFYLWHRLIINFTERILTYVDWPSSLIGTIINLTFIFSVTMFLTHLTLIKVEKKLKLI